MGEHATKTRDEREVKAPKENVTKTGTEGATEVKALRDNAKETKEGVEVLRKMATETGPGVIAVAVTVLMIEGEIEGEIEKETEARAEALMIAGEIENETEIGVRSDIPMKGDRTANEIEAIETETGREIEVTEKARTKTKTGIVIRTENVDEVKTSTAMTIVMVADERSDDGKTNPHAKAPNRTTATRFGSSPIFVYAWFPKNWERNTLSTRESLWT